MEGGDSLLYRGRVDFRDGGRVVIHCYTGWWFIVIQR